MSASSHPDPFSPRPGLPEAARLVWTGDDPPDARGPEIRRARRQALLRGGISLALAALLFLVGWRIVGAIALALGTLTLLAGFLSPQGLHRHLDRLFLGLVALIGRLMTWLVLTPVYLLVFLPYGALFRRGRRDRLLRWYEPEASTYWKEREPASDRAHRHSRQF